jgi:hypothetical protein
MNKSLFVSILLNMALTPLALLYMRQRLLVRPLEAVVAPAVDFSSTEDYSWHSSLYASQPVASGAVVFLGDSLTLGGEWQFVFPGQTVLNRGISSDTTIGVLKRLSEVTRHHPRQLFVMMGVNDLMANKATPDFVVSQYKALIQRVHEASPATTIYLQSLLPTRREWNEPILEVNRQLEKLADGKRVHYVDVCAAMTDGSGQLREDWTFDGVHLKAPAYEAWRKAVRPLIFST